MNLQYLSFSEEVAKALSTGEPILALESTVITHGMPYPENLQTAQMLEDTARRNGVIPATICIMDGMIKIGLSPEELQSLAKSRDAVKASIRDIPLLISQKKYAGTTVAATMFIANLASIPVFSTGGIGGVHRQAETTFDVSADLQALATIPVIVICAGAKSILDIGKTIEYLETQSIPVYGYQTDIFPAFYSSTSPFSVEKIQTPEQIASTFLVQKELGICKGMLIANPIAKEHEISYEKIAPIIEKAVQKANENHIHGKEMTPYLLSTMLELTGGASLKTNIQLIINNVVLGCHIAKALQHRT